MILSKLKSISSRSRVFSRCFSTTENLKPFTPPPREKMNYDVLIVGGGPAGLSAAIELKKLEKKHGKNISVCLIEKGSAIGSHIISGNCFEPRALQELFPDWRKMEQKPPLNTPVKYDKMLFLLNEKTWINIPHFLLPKSIQNYSNYLISLGDMCKWLAERAQELGVEIFTGFSGDEVLYDPTGTKVIGVATGDFGISKTGEPKSNYTRGIELIANQTIFAEGVRGSLTERIIEKYQLRATCDPQTYGIGMKEIWEVKPNKFKSGLVEHTVGWPLSRSVYGGSFVYHIEPNQVHIGFVVALDYKNVYLSPYEEFQKFKTHKKIQEVLEGGNCISYGARALNEGGYFAIPKLTFPGGLLVGCSAGFLNVMKIKGSHNAMKSGMVAAKSVFNSVTANEGRAAGEELKEYEENMKKSWVFEELHISRNFKGAWKFNMYFGLIYGAFINFLSKGREFWSFRNKKKDSNRFIAKEFNIPISYKKPDGVLTFDILTNLARSGTNHEADQPSHLRIKPHLAGKPKESYEKFDAPEQRFCPAKVYEFVNDEKTGEPKLQINHTNCLHCKTCSIKMIGEYIDWNVPEGGGGPNYSGM